jgi:hypothetical protein
MSVNEELEEHTHEAKEPFDKRVAATMAIIAAALAVVSVAGHILTTDELLGQQKASDQWSYYQAKSIRRFSAEATFDLLSTVKSEEAVAGKYKEAAKKYKEDAEEIQKEALELEKESHLRGDQALRAHFGEVFLEIAIVFSSLAILTKRSLLYWTAVVSALIGGVAAATAYFAT